MPPALRRRGPPAGSAEARSASPPARAAAAARPHRKAKADAGAGAKQSRGSMRRALTLALALAAAAAAVSAALPKWRAALEDAAAAPFRDLPIPDDPAAGPAPLPRRKFVEPSGGPVPADPANPTDAEVAAALGELGREALPRVPAGPSGYITAAELEAAGLAEDALRPRLRAAVVGAFVADAATVGVHG
jgi:hypothetical protein